MRLNSPVRFGSIDVIYLQMWFKLFIFEVSCKGQEQVSIVLDFENFTCKMLRQWFPRVKPPVWIVVFSLLVGILDLILSIWTCLPSTADWSHRYQACLSFLLHQSGHLHFIWPGPLFWTPLFKDQRKALIQHKGKKMKVTCMLIHFNKPISSTCIFYHWKNYWFLVKNTKVTITRRHHGWHAPNNDPKTGELENLYVRLETSVDIFL